MDWTAAGVIVSGALALVAIVVQQVNRRSDRDEARRGSAQASQRADAAQAAAERSAAAAERMAKAQEDHAVAAARAAPTPQAAWTLGSLGDGHVLLTNVGNAAAYDLRIRIGTNGGGDRKALEHADLAPGLALRLELFPGFLIVPPDDTVTVTWAAVPGGETVGAWSRALPPPPSTGGRMMSV